MAGETGGIVEYFSPGDRFTAKVDEASGVVGGNVLTLTGTSLTEVGVCGASDNPVGVALHSADDNEIVTVVTEGVWPLVASGAVTEGNVVVAAAAGKVVALAATTEAPYLIVGIALKSISDTAAGPIKLRL